MRRYVRLYSLCSSIVLCNCNHLSHFLLAKLLITVLLGLEFECKSDGCRSIPSLPVPKTNMGKLNLLFKPIPNRHMS